MSGGEVVALVAVWAAFAYLAIVSVVLAVIDARSHRLPNRIVLPSYAVALGLLATATIFDQDAGRLLRALSAMAILFVAYLAMRVASPTSIGGGDVKLAGLLGLYLGWVGWSTLLVGTAASFVVAGSYALVLILRKRADRRTRIAFGPAMLVGAWVAIAAGVLARGVGMS